MKLLLHRVGCGRLRAQGCEVQYTLGTSGSAHTQGLLRHLHVVLELLHACRCLSLMWAVAGVFVRGVADVWVAQAAPDVGAGWTAAAARAVAAWQARVVHLQQQSLQQRPRLPSSSTSASQWQDLPLALQLWPGHCGQLRLLRLLLKKHVKQSVLGALTLQLVHQGTRLCRHCCCQTELLHQRDVLRALGAVVHWWRCSCCCHPRAPFSKSGAPLSECCYSYCPPDAAQIAQMQPLKVPCWLCLRMQKVVQTQKMERGPPQVLLQHLAMCGACCAQM